MQCNTVDRLSASWSPKDRVQLVCFLPRLARGATLIDVLYKSDR